MATTREQLLREYVRRALREDFGGADFGGDMGGMGFGFGGGYVQPSDMYKVFIKPFTDVYDTAVGKTKEMSIATAELLRVSMEAILTSIIPILSSDYDKIFAKYEGQMDKVRAEYKDIYDATWTAFKDNDVVLAAFGMFPELMLTQVVARHAPIPVIHTMDALTGGFFETYFERLLDTLKLGEEVKPLEDKGGGGGGDVWGMGGYGYGGDYGGFDGGGFGEGVLREKGGERRRKKPDIVDRILHPKIMAAIGKNSRTQEMKKSMRQAWLTTLEELADRAEKVMKVQSVAELQSLTGKQIPGLDKLKQMPPEQAKAANQQIIQSVRKAIKSMYVKNMQLQIKAAKEAGVPEGHPMLSDLAKVAKRIKSL